jgi:hypothetical protein
VWLGAEAALFWVAKLPVVALRAVDDYLIVVRQPCRPTGLALSRDAAAPDTLQAVRLRDAMRTPPRRQPPDSAAQSPRSAE